MSWHAHQPINEEERRHDRSWNDPPLFTDDQLNQAPKVPIHKRYARVAAPEITPGGGNNYGNHQQQPFNPAIGQQQPFGGYPAASGQWSQQPALQQPAAGYNPRPGAPNPGYPTQRPGFPLPPTPTSPTGNVSWPQQHNSASVYPQQQQSGYGGGYQSDSRSNSFVSQPPAPVPAFPTAPIGQSIPPPPSSLASGLNSVANVQPTGYMPPPASMAPASQIGNVPPVPGHVQHVSAPVNQYPPPNGGQYGQPQQHYQHQQVAYGQPWDQQQQQRQY